MVQVIVMSVFCIFALVYGFGVVFKRPWLIRLTGGKSKHNEETTVNKMRQIIGVASLVFGFIGMIINISLAYILLRGGVV